MPDSQGYATKEELLALLSSAGFEGKVEKLVACAGFVKVWLSTAGRDEDRARIRTYLASRPGVQAVTLVPEGVEMESSNQA